MATTGTNKIEVNRNTGCEGLSPLPPLTEEQIEVRLAIDDAVAKGLLRFDDRPSLNDQIAQDKQLQREREQESLLFRGVS